MKTMRKREWNAVLCAFGLLAAAGSHAQDNAVAPPSAPAQRSAAAIEQLVQPIAAYTDYLVGIILPASVYPLEIGDAAFQLAQTNVAVDISAQSWDPSIKSLARFPSVVQWMDRNLPWTVEVGRTFLAQQKDVLDAIQRARSKAYAAGTLKSDAFQTVTKATTASGKEVITITPITSAATGTSLSATATPPAVSATPVATTSPSSYAPPSAYPPAASSSNAKSAAGLVVGVAATAAIVNNVDWDEKYVVNTPGGVVIVDEDDLEDFQDQRTSAQPQPTSASTAAPAAKSGNTAKTGTQPSTTAANKGTAATQPARQPAAATQPTKTAWQPDSSRMAGSGAPQPSTANQSAAARGWSKPATQSGTKSVNSYSGSSRSSSSGLSNMREGSRARAYSGRGATSRSGSSSTGRRGR